MSCNQPEKFNREFVNADQMRSALHPYGSTDPKMLRSIRLSQEQVLSIVRPQRKAHCTGPHPAFDRTSKSEYFISINRPLR